MSDILAGYKYLFDDWTERQDKDLQKDWAEVNLALADLRGALNGPKYIEDDEEIVESEDNE